MTLGEFRRLTAALPNSLEITVRTYDDDGAEFIGPPTSVEVENAHDEDDTPYLCINGGPMIGT